MEDFNELSQSYGCTENWSNGNNACLNNKIIIDLEIGYGIL